MFPSTDLGPCEIWAGTNIAAAVKICDTVGGFKLGYTEEYAETKMDKTGNRGRSKVVIGGECKGTGAAGEATLTQIAALAGQTVDTGGTRLALNSRIGDDLRADAQLVVIKPIINNVVSTTAADWFYIPAATFEVNWELVWDVSGQRVYGFAIEGHPVTEDEIVTGGRLISDGYDEGDILVLGN